MNNEIIISNHSPQDIAIQQNENQLILINGGGEVIGITDVKVNGSSVVTNNVAYIIVPTKLSQLQNDEHFITTETDPTVPSYVKQISNADINNWNNKQNALVSGSTIKTINNESILGSGNIEITGTQYSAGDGIDITNDVISNTITSYNDLEDLPTIPTNTSDLINDSDFVSENELAEVAFTGGYGSLSNTPEYTSDFINDGDGTHKFISDYSNQNIKGIDWNSNKWGIVNGDNLLFNALQDELISGTNIKTINNESLLGSGNITISGGTPTDVQINGTSIVSNNTANIVTESAYNSSTNKIATKNDIPTQTSQLTNNSNFAVTNANNNFSADQTFNGKINGMYSILINGPTSITIDLSNTGGYGIVIFINQYGMTLVNFNPGTENIVDVHGSMGFQYTWNNNVVTVSNLANWQTYFIFSSSANITTN